MTTTRSPAYRYFLRQLVAARIEAHLTQAQVASALGLRQQLISDMESGERRVDLIEANRFARLYGKPLSWFVQD